MADKKIWFSFRGPYDVSAWATLWSVEEMINFFKDHEIMAPLLASHLGELHKIRVEINRGENDEDGRIYSWGYDQPHAEGPDTQHEGTLVYIDDELVYNDNKFVDTETEGHDPEDCEVCSQPMA